jgi:tetratricopeptide (TPR) repeat protein
MSVSAFLLLLRGKPSSGPGSPKPPPNALRHELSELNRLIAEFDLPVVVERRGAGIQAHIDNARLHTNIDQAKSLFAKARMSFAAGAFERAVRYAEQALEADYDFIAAVTLLARIREVSDCHLSPCAVARAEICIARAMIRSAAALQRLNRIRTAGDPYTAKARETAQRMLVRLEHQWHVFGSWNFEMSQTDLCDPSDRIAIRSFLNLVVDARRRDHPDVYKKFAGSALIADVIDRLLKGRVSNANPVRYKEAAAYLTIEILTPLVLNGWLPAPAMSKREFMEQLIRHLVERRIDWGKVLGRSARGRREFRGELNEVDDDANENNADEDAIEDDE